MPGGIIAVWSYHGFHVTPEVEAVIHRLYRDVVGPYWPAERAIVDRGYQELEFPFEAVAFPALALEKRWDLAALVGYLRTWSATQRYEAALGKDPLLVVARELEEAWGDPRTVRPFRWDLDMPDRDESESSETGSEGNGRIGPWRSWTVFGGP